MARGKSSARASKPGRSKKASSTVSGKRGLKGKGVGSWIKGAAKKTGNFLYKHGSKIATTAATAAALAAAGYGTYKAAKAGKDAIDYADKKGRKAAAEAVEYASKLPAKASNGAHEAIFGQPIPVAGDYHNRPIKRDPPEQVRKQYEEELRAWKAERARQAELKVVTQPDYERTFVSPDVQLDVDALSRQRHGVHHQDEFFDAREYGGKLKGKQGRGLEDWPHEARERYRQTTANIANINRELRNGAQHPSAQEHWRRELERQRKRMTDLLDTYERPPQQSNERVRKAVTEANNGGGLKHCPSSYGGRMTVKRLEHLKHCHKCSTGKGAHVLKALGSIKLH